MTPMRAQRRRRMVDAVVGFGAGALLVVSVLVLLDAWVLRQQRLEIVRKQVLPEVEGLARHLAREDSLLGQYRWVDAERGTVRIPIERAMQLVVEANAEEGGAR